MLNYKDYLQSAHWQEIRAKYSARDCDRCRTLKWICDLAYGKGMNVHHLNYDHLWHERDEDLEVLCRRCHELEHFKKTNLPKIILEPCRYCNRPKIIFDPPIALEQMESDLYVSVVTRWHSVGRSFRSVPASEKLFEIMKHPTCRAPIPEPPRWPHLVGKGILFEK